MIERTEDEKITVALKTLHAVEKEAAMLWENGHHNATKVMLEYIGVKTENLVSFHDFFVNFHGKEIE